MKFLQNIVVRSVEGDERQLWVENDTMFSILHRQVAWNWKVLLPLFVMDVLGHVPGIPGLFVSCIFSGALSTLSSGLNSIAAVLLQDVLKVFCGGRISTEARATAASKLIALTFGFVCLGLTYVASLLGGVLQAALALFGVMGGPILGVFTLGMLFPWANQKGAVTGMLTALTFMLWISVGYQVHKPKVAQLSPTRMDGCNWNLTTTMAPVTVAMSNLSSVTTSILPVMTNITTTMTSTAPEEYGPLMQLYSLSYLWYSATALLITVGIGLIVSFLTGKTNPVDVNPKLICPIFDIVFPFLPERYRKPLRFGVRHEEVKYKGELAVDLEVEPNEKDGLPKEELVHLNESKNTKNSIEENVPDDAV